MAEIADTLTFHGPISAGATATITMTATTNYSPLFNSGPDGHSGGLGYGYSGMTVYNSSGTLFSGGAICAPDTPSAICSPFELGDISLEDTGSFNSITATIDLSEHRTVQVLFVVAAYSTGDGSANVDDPITIELPAGVTYTSASGEFLTRIAAAPEPATWTMLLLGFAGFGFAGRRKAMRALAAASRSGA